MTTMPHWLAKTREMVAMDRWFNDEGSVLVDKYRNAIASIETPRPGNGLPTTSDALDSSGMDPADVADAFDHLGKDWLNPNNSASGGNFWPHVATLNIKIWLKKGLLNAMHKGLGRTALESNLIGKTPDQVDAIFESEIRDSGLTDDELAEPLPLVTTWVCTAPAGTGSIEVDALRGPTVVELIIATPQPKTVQSRIWAEVSGLIDDEWNALHGGSPPSP